MKGCWVGNLRNPFTYGELVKLVLPGDLVFATHFKSQRFAGFQLFNFPLPAHARLSPCAGKRGIAESTQLNGARKLIAIGGGGKLQGHRHG